MSTVDRLSDHDLRQLAVDVYEGRAFIANHDEAIRCAFGAIIAMIGPSSVPDNAGAVWEYIDKAGEFAINGYPAFLSCRFLAAVDVEPLCELLEELKRERAAFVGEGDA